MTANQSGTPLILQSAPREERAVVCDRKRWRISRAELERRWTLVREHMRSRGIEALIVQGYEEKTGGNVRWLTDVPPGYTRTIVFHRDDPMTLIDHGPQGETRQLDDRDPNRPGVGELITNWALSGGHFTSGLAALDVIGVIRKRGYGAVGIAGEKYMPHGFISELKQTLGGAVRFTDETDFLDAARAQKSAEEISSIRRTAEMQDQVFATLLEWITPGVRDFEINAFVDYQMQLLGSERGVYIGVSAPLGQAANFGYRHFQGRTMQRGDHMNVLLESNGIGGQWTELGRLISFGKVPARTQDAHAVCVEAQVATANLCVAGATPADIFSAHNDFMTRHGSEPEKRLHSHGQGYDAVERPFIRSDETMSLVANVNLSIHPSYSAGSTFATICDNFVVLPAGSGEFLHRTPRTLFEL